MVANTTWNIYNFRLNVVRKLLDEDYVVTVIAPVDEYIRYREQYPSVQHINLRQLDRDTTNPWKDARLLGELYSIYKEIRPDLILHYTVKPNIYGGLAAAMARIPSVAVVTGLGYPFIHNGLVRKATRELYRLSNRYHRMVIFENKDDQELFIEQHLVNAGRSLSIKGCGVDTNYFYPRENAGQDGKVVFTFIGRLLYDKGIKEFIEAAKMIRKESREAEFWLLGEIDQENPSAVKKEDLIEWLSEPHIHYLGSVKDVRPIMAKSDCIVLPSYREGFSRVLMEAMSMAKPVITTDVPGCREAVEEGKTGLLVTAGNSESLTKAFLRFCSLDTISRLAMGQRGRSKAVAEFSDEMIGERFFKLLDGMIHQ